MLANYTAAGFEPNGFWHITPRELSYRLKGAHMRFEREYNDRAWLAWHVAALSRIEKLPALEKLLIGQKKEREPEPWESQFAKWQAYIESVSK